MRYFYLGVLAGGGGGTGTLFTTTVHFRNTLLLWPQNWIYEPNFTSGIRLLPFHQTAPYLPNCRVRFTENVGTCYPAVATTSPCVFFFLRHKYPRLSSKMQFKVLTTTFEQTNKKNPDNLFEHTSKRCTHTDWGVCSWPWQLFVLENANRPLFVTSKQCITVKYILGLSAVVFWDLRELSTSVVLVYFAAKDSNHSVVFCAWDKHIYALFR